MATPSRRSIQVREHLVALLRDADGPMSTQMLQASVNGPGYRDYPHLYNQLRALERTGICRRLPRGHATGCSTPDRLWSYTHNETFAAVCAALDD